MEKLARRRFLTQSAAAIGWASMGTGIHAEDVLPIQVNRLDGSAHRMPDDFTGLSFEMPQLYSPEYFSASNSKLLEAFHGLGQRGVLRLGGSLSEYTRWQPDKGDFSSAKEETAIRSQNNWEWRLANSKSIRADHGAITPASLHALRGFLDATDWRCIYGLNFGSGSPARAADEADHVYRILGPRLLCFQLGNEADFFAGNPLFRSKPYGFEQYWADYQQFVGAVRAVQPQAKFAGPDVANNLAWVREYAERAKGEAPFVSAHHYAMGPAKDPAMNVDRLLARHDHALEKYVAEAGKIVADCGVPFRITECNSCFGGGKDGVSNTFASALWVADFMLQVAAAGCIGVNLHGGGDGLYTPIESIEDAQVLRPLYYGMQFAGKLAGYEIAPCSLPESVNASVYVGRRKRTTCLAIVNKSLERLTVAPDLAQTREIPSECEVLSAPELSTKEGVSLRAVSLRRSKVLAVDPLTAVLFRWG